VPFVVPGVLHLLRPFPLPSSPPFQSIFLQAGSVSDEPLGLIPLWFRLLQSQSRRPNLRTAYLMISVPALPCTPQCSHPNNCRQAWCPCSRKGRAATLYICSPAIARSVQRWFGRGVGGSIPLQLLQSVTGTLSNLAHRASVPALFHAPHNAHPQYLSARLVPMLEEEQQRYMFVPPRQRDSFSAGSGAVASGFTSPWHLQSQSLALSPNLGHRTSVPVLFGSFMHPTIPTPNTCRLAW
jgi:hypothetical protein